MTRALDLWEASIYGGFRSDGEANPACRPVAGTRAPAAFMRAATAAPVPRLPPLTSARSPARFSFWVPAAVVMVR